MNPKRHKRSISALLALALLYLAVVYVVPAFSNPERASSNCTLHERHVIGSGALPDHRAWRVVADVRSNGGCSTWLLRVEFYPFGTYAGSWRGSWGIPAKGHLASNFAISAQDAFNPAKRAISGIIGKRVKKVVAVTTDGSYLVIRPQLPPRRLMLHNVWLRNFRFFVRYYSPGTRVRIIRLFNSDGKSLGVVHGEEGEFDRVD